MFTHPQMVTHPSTNPAVHGWESNSRPVDHKSDALTTTPPSHKPSTVSRVLWNEWHQPSVVLVSKEDVEGTTKPWRNPVQL